MERTRQKKKALKPVNLYVGLSVDVCDFLGFDLIGFLCYGHSSSILQSFEEFFGPHQFEPDHVIESESNPPGAISILQHIQSIDHCLTVELRGDGSQRQLILSKHLSQPSERSQDHDDIDDYDHYNDPMHSSTDYMDETPSSTDDNNVKGPLHFYIETPDHKLRDKTITFFNHIINLTRLAYHRHIAMMQHRTVIDPRDCLLHDDIDQPLLLIPSIDHNNNNTTSVNNTGKTLNNTHDEDTIIDDENTILHYCPESIHDDHTVMVSDNHDTLSSTIYRQTITIPTTPLFLDTYL